jgi:predicted ribosome quality control (RQC) complex YloA/Tae2 family protein
LLPMVTAADVRRWADEAAPALRGTYVHRIWRADEAWVLLCRRHEADDPAQRATARVALELAPGGPGPRAVALPPDAVDADDERQKKAQGRDANAFLAQLRKVLVGAKVEGLAAVKDERLVTLDLVRAPGAADEAPGDGSPPTRARLVVELIGRTGNLVLCARDGEHVVVLAPLIAGKGARTLERGARYIPPAPRATRPEGDDQPSLCGDVAPDPESLALGQAVAAAQRAKEEEAAQASRAVGLRRAARQSRERAEGTIGKLEQQLEESKRADEVEHKADLLKQHLKTIARGATEARLTDHLPDGTTREVVIPLDPAEPVLDQMQALYKKARKLRSGEVAVQQRLGETDRLIEELRALEARAEEVDPEDEAALDALEAALRKKGALPKETGPKQAPKQPVNQGPRSFRTKEGHEVLVGRNDDENDRLTMRTARGNDLFFHVAGCPGSHVILRVDPKRPPNHESLMDAAAVAIHYSKARDRGAADVHYTPRKWVKKPRGAKPGLVQISNHKTIRAGGDPARVQRVLSTAATRDAADPEEQS